MGITRTRMSFVTTVLAKPIKKKLCYGCKEPIAFQASFTGKWLLIDTVPSTSQPDKVIPLFDKIHNCKN